MKRPIHFFVSLLLVFAMLSPVATYAANDGKKHFREGMKHEYAEEWDKAAEQFALAVSANPRNPEYRLHLTRSLFNASQMFMKKGRNAAEEQDFEGAYLAFRRAYAFDPTNELAKSEMERMVRLQRESVDPDAKKTAPSGDRVGMVPAGFNNAAGRMAAPQLPQKMEKLRDVPFPAGVDMQFIIKELARDLDLNVLFDVDLTRQPGRKVSIELRNVTAARALDYIFLQEGLFFQKVGPRTILVALQNKRMMFQQLVLRTFYLSNASPKDVAKVVQTAIPAQPGRTQTIVLTDDATNSITIRDTEENVKLIGGLIASLDKDRAEVVMDVAIYEINKNDLLQLGNQIGSQNQLTNLGGSGQGAVGFGNTLFNTIVSGTSAVTLPTAIATGIILPSSNISAFQSRNSTKLLASTQIHAFNNEDSSARIGQRVPVRTSTFQTGNVVGGSVVSDVINYEQVGLTLKFKPLVFPNQDVQVAMEIESKDVSGAQTLTPTFTERTIKGTARIQNNKTLLLASVAQDVESSGRAGLPLLGLIPIIGRLFSTPTRDNRQVDIVIAVTPRVIRAPAILPEDEIERPTGSIQMPTNSNLEAMLIEEERIEMLATARNLPTNVEVQLPDQAVPEYVPSPVTADARQASAAPVTTTAPAPAFVGTPSVRNDALPIMRPIDTSARTLQLNQTSMNAGPTAAAATATESTVSSKPTASVVFGGQLPAMKAGERVRLPINISSTGSFRSAVIGLRFDAAEVAVRRIVYGDIFGTTQEGVEASPFLNSNGRTYVTLTAPDGIVSALAGTVIFVEVEALKDGQPVINFDPDILNLLTSDGKNFSVDIARVQ